MSEATMPPLCPKHNKQTIFVCSVQTCKQRRLICQQCKQKQTLHFMEHSKFIYRLKELKEFYNTNKIVGKLQGGLGQCEKYVMEHRKYYGKQIADIREDFVNLKKEFITIADKYEQIYVSSFQKQIQKFDAPIRDIRTLLRQFLKENSEQKSLFSMLFQPKQPDINNIDEIEATVQKNSKAYKVRAALIDLRSIIALAKNNKTIYKQTQQDKRKFQAIHDQLDFMSRRIFDKFKQILGSENENGDDLKMSIVNQSRSLAISRAMPGSLVDLQNDLNRSQVSTLSSSRDLQIVQMPKMDPIVAMVKSRLKELQPRARPNLNIEGPYLYSTGVYFGQYDNGRRHGWGQFVFSDGALYIGEWDNDTLSGFGRLIRKDCYYEGVIKNGKANGPGNYQDQIRCYKGQWRDDRRHGTGQQQFKNKTRKYVGGFVDDKYHGKGRLITQEYTYQGRFQNGLFHFQGIIRFNNGEVYEGTFVEGQKNFGRHVYPDGSYYDGTYKNNVPDGTGEFYWADGVKYSGRWKEGVQDGTGLQFFPDGRELKGIWKAGKWQRWL